MINTESVVKFSKTLPKQAESEYLLSLKMYSPHEVISGVLELASHGYLGCLPFAGDETDQIVVRLLPNCNIADCPVAVASGYVTDGLTIVSSLDRFVAGRIAQREIVTHHRDDLFEYASHLLNFTENFGKVSTVERILAGIDEIAGAEKILRSGKTWEIADPDDHLCQTLAAAWTRKKQALGDWASEAVHGFPEIDIVWRLYVTHHILTGSGQDITDAVVRLIMGDSVFDSSYISRFRKPGLGTWEIGALVLSIKWLQQRAFSTSLIPSPLWDAAKAYAQDIEGYNGTKHLEAAKQFVDNPVLAYTHAANAAGFCVRTTGQLPIEAILFAHRLAVENGWQDLKMALDWVINGLDI
jgi:hypothetical protein